MEKKCTHTLYMHNWPDCKAIPAYGLMMSVCLSVRQHLVNIDQRLSLFSVTLISTDSVPCMGIDLDEISLTAIFPCDPDLDFFCSKSHNNFG